MADIQYGDFFSIEPIQRVSVTTMITEKITSMIKDGTLKPGDKLPSQSELQTIFGVSKPALRESMTGLTMLGYIESRVGSGYYVRNMEVFSLIPYNIIKKLISDEDISSLFEARLLFETSATALAASRATEEDIQKLYAYLENYNEDTFSDGITKEGLGFHQLVVDSCHNVILSAIEKQLISVFREYGKKVYQKKIIYDFDIQSHKAIVDCIANRDPQGAYDKAIDDIRGFIKTIKGDESLTENLKV